MSKKWKVSVLLLLNYFKKYFKKIVTPPSFLGWAPTCIFHFFCLSIHLSICLSRTISGTVHPCDHNFWYTCVKWWYLQAFFSFFFFNFDFSGCYGCKRAKNCLKWPKLKNKNYICLVAHLRKSIAYDHDFWYAFVNWWYLQVFFSYFQNFDFT